jgi:hypothetical protein
MYSFKHYANQSITLRIARISVRAKKKFLASTHVYFQFWTSYSFAVPGINPEK